MIGAGGDGFAALIISLTLGGGRRRCDRCGFESTPLGEEASARELGR